MSKKLISLAAFVLLLGIAINAAANTYTDTGPTHFFDDPENWSEGVPYLGAPGGQRWADMTVDDTICIVDANQDVSANGFYPGCYGGDNEFYMTGGRLTVNFFNVGRGRADGDNEGSKGYFLMTGGVIETEGFKIPNQFDEQDFGPWTGTEGHVDLYGGEIRVSGWFLIGNRDPHVYEGGTGTMDITEGKLIVDGDVVDQIQGYIDDPNGWITAYGGKGKFELDYDERNLGTTTLTAFETAKAYWPTPKDGVVDLQPGVVLTWWPGVDAATENAHDVYFGADAAAVADANHSSPEYMGRQDPNYYPVIGTLDLDLETTYYWRIDEVNDPNLWKGKVWSFTTANYVALDNMDSYGEVDILDQPGSRIWFTWKDGEGWINPLPGTSGNGTGSVVDVDTSTVHEGGQSMKFDYDNDGTNVLGSPGKAYYSELKADIAELPIAPDWNAYDAKALDLWFRGTEDNDTTEQMWIALEDAAGTSAVVPYNGNMNDIALQKWKPWRISLQEFMGVNLADVKSIAIGFGTRGNTITHGGAGTVYFDSIRVYPCRSGGLAADLNGDCVVNYVDLSILMDSWLDKKLWP